MASIDLQPKDKGVFASLVTLVHAIQNDDVELVEAVHRLSRSRPFLAPLAFTVGAFAMLFDGLKLLLGNWRLLLIQMLPAVWIWVAMFDLKVHVLHGRSFDLIRGPVLIPIFLVIIAVSAASFFLNATFAFVIADSPPKSIREGRREAREHLTPVLVSGSLLGAVLAVAATIAPRWGPPWFTVTMGVVVGIMMVCYVAVPARLIGAPGIQSRRDKLTVSLLGSLLGATVSAPGYVLGRVGILMLGSRALLIPGIVVAAVGLTLQLGATGAVRTIKLGAALTSGGPPSAPRGP
jgi:hypothetical protein